MSIIGAYSGKPTTNYIFSPDYNNVLIAPFYIGRSDTDIMINKLLYDKTWYIKLYDKTWTIKKIEEND